MFYLTINYYVLSSCLLAYINKTCSIFKVINVLLWLIIFVLGLINIVAYDENKKEQNYSFVDPKRRIDLSTYVVSFANAASVAQQELSNKKSPMAIREAEFKVNITTDVDINDEQEIKLKVVNMSIDQKIISNYKEHFGVEMRFLLVPTGLINND